MNAELRLLWGSRGNLCASNLYDKFANVPSESRNNVEWASVFSRICTDMGRDQEALDVLDALDSGGGGEHECFNSVTRFLAGEGSAVASLTRVFYEISGLPPVLGVRKLQEALSPFDAHLWVRLDAGEPKAIDCRLLSRYLRIYEYCLEVGVMPPVLWMYFSRFMSTVGRLAEADSIADGESALTSACRNVHWATTAYTECVRGDLVSARLRLARIGDPTEMGELELTLSALAAAVLQSREFTHELLTLLIECYPEYLIRGGLPRRFNTALMLRAAGYSRAAERMLSACRGCSWLWFARRKLWQKENHPSESSHNERGSFPC